MNRTLIATTLLVLFALSIALPAQSAGHKVIDGAELEKMIADGKGVTIVDVREPELFNDAHIPGAILIPYDNARSRILKELSPDERIVFVCHGGPMGDKLSSILIKNGYKKVYNLGGGMRRWKGPVTSK